MSARRCAWCGCAQVWYTKSPAMKDVKNWSLGDYMHVLVLGATGFIGGQIARALVERGHSVRALRRATSSLLAIDGLPLEIVQGDLRDRASLLAAMQGVEAVFHAAG